jgi:hypothetical protein
MKVDGQLRSNDCPVSKQNELYCVQGNHIIRI